jgi:hypothetical protein
MGLHRVGTLGHIVSSSNIFYEEDSGNGEILYALCNGNFALIFIFIYKTGGAPEKFTNLPRPLVKRRTVHLCQTF